MYNRLKTVTVLGMLYRKSFLDDNDIRFDENQLYYADAPFFTKGYVLCKKLQM